MDPQTAMQTLMGAQMELWKARNMPQKLGEGEVFGMPGQAPLMSGPQKYRAPQFPDQWCRHGREGASAGNANAI